MSNNVGILGTSQNFTTATSWTAGASPTAGQDVFITNSAITVNAGLNNASVGTLTSMNLVMDFTGQMGINDTSNTYLKLPAAVANFGMPIVGGGNAGGSRVFNWDAGTSNTVANVMNTASSGVVVGQAPLKLLGTNMTVNLTGGIVSIAALPTETATVKLLNIGASGTGISPQIYIGPGCTLNTLNQNAGAVTNASQALVTTALVARGNSSLTHIGTGGYATMTIDNGGKVTYNGTGSINSLTLTGTLDCTGGGGTFTIGSCVRFKGSVLLDPLRRITFTTPPTLSGCSLADIKTDRGQGGAS